MPAVILDQAHWTQLEQVQLEIERKVTYQSDMDRFGVPDWWEPAVDRGDCEDIVLAKRQRLMALGWPADALRIAVVIDGHGELHAVLTVDVIGRKGSLATYVLDSHFTHVEPWNVLGQYGYSWLERSTPGSSQWSRLDSGAPAEARHIASLAAAVMPASPRWSDVPAARTPVAVAAVEALVPADAWIEAAQPTPVTLGLGRPVGIEAQLIAASDRHDGEGRRHGPGREHQRRHGRTA